MIILISWECSKNHSNPLSKEITHPIDGKVHCYTNSNQWQSFSSLHHSTLHSLLEMGLTKWATRGPGASVGGRSHIIDLGLPNCRMSDAVGCGEPLSTHNNENGWGIVMLIPCKIRQTCIS